MNFGLLTFLTPIKKRAKNFGFLLSQLEFFLS
jgi:hypothetical protein